MAATENATFSIPVNFQGVEPWDPTKGGVNDPDPGAYACKVTKAVEYAKDDGKKSIKVTVAGPFGETDLYLGLDFSKGGNVRKLATAIQSIGIDYAALQAKGSVNVTSAWFMGKDGKGAPCFIIVKAVEGTDAQGRKKLNDKEFATKAQFEAYNAAMASGGAPANGAPAASGTPANGAGGDLASLFPG
jgi:hypothetical protein